MINLDKEINLLVATVKEATASTADEWVQLNRLDLIRLTKCSGYASLKAIRQLRFHPNILSRRRNGRAQYRYVSAEEKARLGPLANEFACLSKDEFAYIQSLMKLISPDDLTLLTEVLNPIILAGAKGYFVPLDRKEIAKSLMISSKAVDEAFDLMLDCHILIQAGQYYKLALSQQELSDTLKSINDNTYEIIPEGSD